MNNTVKFNDRKNLFEAKTVKYFSQKIRKSTLRLNDFTLDSREGPSKASFAGKISGSCSKTTRGRGVFRKTWPNIETR